MMKVTQEEQYQMMYGVLNERQWCLYVATKAKRMGVGGISQVAREAGVTRKTIRKGIGELAAGAI
jgi:DNA-binding phage protein